MVFPKAQDLVDGHVGQVDADRLHVERHDVRRRGHRGQADDLDQGRVELAPVGSGAEVLAALSARRAQQLCEQHQ